MRRNSKTACAVISFLFSWNLILAPWAEANFWKERSQSLSRLFPSPPVSSVPIKKFPPSFPVQVPQNISHSLTKEILSVLPSSKVQILKVADFGKKIEQPWVLIQDIHQNAEAQFNIASALQALIDSQKAGVVGVEGAFGPFDFSIFRRFPDKAIVKDVANAFIENNLMAAPSYVGIISPVPFNRFVGVDDRPHYDANVTAIFESRQKKSEFLREIGKKEVSLFGSPSEGQIPVDLKKFLTLQKNFYRRKIDFGSFVGKASDFGIPGNGEIEKFKKAFAIEKSIAFPRLEKERKDILGLLSHSLSAGEARLLWDESRAYQSGQLNFGSFYKTLHKLCLDKEINMSRVPELKKYIDYVLLADSIDSNKLFKEINNWENQIISHLSENPADLESAKTNWWICLAEKIARLELTFDEWIIYQKLKKDLAGHLAEIDFLSKPFENFYREADIRSRHIFQNLKKSRSAGSKVMVLGGFHTEEVCRLLAKNKISFIVISPKISHLGNTQDEDSYLSAFSKEKTPLEKLFSGEKLTIGSENLPLGVMNPPANSALAARGRLFLALAAAKIVHLGLSMERLSFVIVKKAGHFYEVTTNAFGKSVKNFLFPSSPSTTKRNTNTVQQLAGWSVIRPPSAPGGWAGLAKYFGFRAPNNIDQARRLFGFLGLAEGTITGIILFNLRAHLYWALAVWIFVNGIHFLGIYVFNPKQGRWQILSFQDLKKSPRQFLEGFFLSNLVAATSLFGFLPIFFNWPSVFIFIFSILPHISAGSLIASRPMAGSSKRFAMVAAEVDGFGKVGGVADVVDEFSRELADLGHHVDIFVPLAKSIDRTQLTKTDWVVNVPMGPKGLKKGIVWKSQLGGVQIFFIEEEEYFGRDNLYGWPDDMERFAFFDRAAIEAMRKTQGPYDVIQCHDWNGGLVPAYIEEEYNKKGIPDFQNTKTVYTVHNLRFPGKFGRDDYAVTGLSWDLYQMNGVEFYGDWSFAKAGMYYADYTTVVSKEYLKEILTEERGEGFHGLLQTLFNAGRLHALPNGLNKK